MEAVAFVAGLVIGFVACLMTFVLTGRDELKKLKSCNALYSVNGEVYCCWQIEAPTCVNGLCLRHCGGRDCRCCKETGT